jgi:hypothetical protein
LEGFESEKLVPKIIAAKTVDEAERYLDTSAFAVSGLIAESEFETAKARNLKIPILKSITQTRQLADLVEQKAIVQ